jgi:type VI secretion system protein ImpH
MGTDERSADDSLIERLVRRPQGFNLFQAISLLERTESESARIGTTGGRREAVRLSALVSLGFQPSDVAQVGLGAVTGESFTLSTPVLSLAGAQGPLPLPFTELLLERRGARDRAALEFLDIFNHRFLSFLYRGRKKHHVGLNWDSHSASALASCLDRLSALGLAAGARSPQGETEWLRHAGLMGGAPRSMTGLIALLSDRFGVRARGVQFQGGWTPLDTREWSRLGGRGPAAPRLGRNAVLGRRAWDQAAGIRIEFGKLPPQRLATFLPGQPQHGLARWLVRRYLQQDLQVELSLQPAPQELGASTLASASPMRLGWTSWLQSRPRADTPLAPARLRLGTAA